MDKLVPYIGNGAYCWPNATAMLLTQIGEDISPSLIEVLGGVGLGAFILKESNLLFFSWELPDNGIDNALAILGFEVKTFKYPKKDDTNIPLAKLKEDLKKNPAVVGPLDMGYLNYNPISNYLKGVDHFVLALEMDDKEIKFHDPAEFPFVSLTLDQFKKAWKKEPFLLPQLLIPQDHQVRIQEISADREFHTVHFFCLGLYVLNLHQVMLV